MLKNYPKKVSYVFFTEYEGEFLGGVRHGQGTQYNSDGSVFQGQFEFGYPQGFGVMQRPNGDRIEGEFQNGHPHGKIVIKLAGKKDHRIGNVKNFCKFDFHYLR